MNPNTVPRFVKDPKTWQLKVAATTPRATPAGEGTTFSMLTGAANNTRIDFFRAQAQGATVASLIFLFKLDVGGTTHLIDELVVNAASAADGNTSGFEVELTPTKPIYLLENESIYLGVNTTTGIFSVLATGGDF